MSYLEPILVHPVRRQNFGDGVAQTCNPHLIPCHREDKEHMMWTANKRTYDLISQKRLLQNFQCQRHPSHKNTNEE